MLSLRSLIYLWYTLVLTTLSFTGTQVQLKTPIVKNEKTQGTHQASKGEVAKTKVAKLQQQEGPGIHGSREKDLTSRV